MATPQASEMVEQLCAGVRIAPRDYQRRVVARVIEMLSGPHVERRQELPEARSVRSIARTRIAVLASICGWCRCSRSCLRQATSSWSMKRSTVPLDAIRVLSEPALAGTSRRGDMPLPTKALVDLDGEHCRVYDLLNVAGKIATHMARDEEARALQSWIGGTLADEFDLEGTAGQIPEFTDLFLRGRLSAETGGGHDGHDRSRGAAPAAH